jgi:hypothetical protein
MPPASAPEGLPSAHHNAAERPLVADPVLSNIAPLLPEVDAPEYRLTLPLAPFADAPSRRSKDSVGAVVRWRP